MVNCLYNLHNVFGLDSISLFADSVVVMVNSSQSVNEDDGSVSVCVDSGITGSLQTELLVTIAASVGSACT